MRILPRKISLSSSPFYASTAVIFFLGVFMAIFWAFNEYEAYSESIENINQSYRERYRDRVEEEVDKVINFVEYRRSQANQRIESEIRDRVQSAYSIASHMYSRHKDEMSLDDLKNLVVEVLRPIRWSNGRGYYIAGNVGNGVLDLYADDPYYEGKSSLAPGMQDVQEKIVRIVKIIKDKGAGIYRYDWSKPGSVGRVYPKMTFVKYFKPFDWYIGAGIYLDDLERDLQEDILERIQNIRFGQDGEIIGFRFDGTIICHQNERFIGRSIRDFGEPGEQGYGDEMWYLGLSEAAEGVVNYNEATVAGQDKVGRKLAYVKAYKDWSWVFVATTSMEDMEQAIENERRTYLRIAFKNTVLFIVLFIFAVFLLLLSAYFFSFRIKQGISLFTDFFRKAADEKIRIEDTHLAFTEFEDLGYLANQMVDDRLQKEMLIRRDELRLDTLLQLGSMEDECFQDKYDFVLERIVRITRSEGGYLALVNNAQTHLNLYSYFELSSSTNGVGNETVGISRPLAQAGLPGEAVQRGEAVIGNHPAGAKTQFFPYPERVRRHLDVPIYNDGRIVLVAGVCNNSSEYDTSDIRQITMLLEGLWLHVLRMCSEEEMARLERQIIAVSEEERSTIGRDLHDDLGSHLSGVMLLCKVLQKKLTADAPDRVEELNAIRNLIREAIDITRRLAQGLYPVHVIEHGIDSALEELKVEVEKLFTVNCRLVIEKDHRDFDKSIIIHLYYIIRESVFNAARHGNPDNIRVELISDERRLSLIVEDDGCGFSEDSTQQGIGLHTMKYRAKAIGARLNVKTEPGKGTRIELQGQARAND
ncbi:MAG: cache domain-containing protein [Desulfocapsaceae bacterium]|nr:cache domain-containing protein [Desulfocapsaceae bacterium]